MLKGQLSSAPWPGKFWMLFTFLCCPLGPTNIPTHTLQLAIHTQLTHHYIL